MKQITAHAFRARCLAKIKQVHATGEPLLVTLHGAPLVKIVPAVVKKHDIFGCWSNKAKIVGDIESPIPVEWNVTTD